MEFGRYQVWDQLRTSFEPDRVMEFGFYITRLVVTGLSDTTVHAIRARCIGVIQLRTMTSNKHLPAYRWRFASFCFSVPRNHLITPQQQSVSDLASCMLRFMFAFWQRNKSVRMKWINWNKKNCKSWTLPSRCKNRQDDHIPNFKFQGQRKNRRGWKGSTKGFNLSPLGEGVKSSKSPSE